VTEDTQAIGKWKDAYQREGSGWRCSARGISVHGIFHTDRTSRIVNLFMYASYLVRRRADQSSGNGALPDIQYCMSQSKSTSGVSITIVTRSVVPKPDYLRRIINPSNGCVPVGHAACRNRSGLSKSDHFLTSSRPTQPSTSSFGTGCCLAPGPAERGLDSLVPSQAKVVR
jgi:hypothetical protein